MTTIYSSTTLPELLDQLDQRAPDLSAAIRARIDELEDDCDVLHAELEEARAGEPAAECGDLRKRVPATERPQS